MKPLDLELLRWCLVVLLHLVHFFNFSSIIVAITVPLKLRQFCILIQSSIKSNGIKLKAL